MLSPETIRLMSQTYEEWMQDPSALSRPLETMTWAYQQICAGADPGEIWRYARDKEISIHGA